SSDEQILLLGSFLSPMFTQPVGNYYRSAQFLYRSSSNLSLFLKNTIGLRINHLHELHLIAHFRFHTQSCTSFQDPLKTIRTQLDMLKNNSEGRGRLSYGA